MKKGEQKGKLTTTTKISGVIFAVAVVLRVIVAAFTDPIIVYWGIRAHSALSASTTVLTALSGCIFLVTLIVWGISYSKLKKEQLINEAENDKGPDLKMKGELDPVKIRENLKEKSGAWIQDTYISGAFNTIYANMDDMDGYQSKLKELLDRNGADALRDTEEVLDKVEQHICRNIRKLINIMIVLDSRNGNDREVLLTTAKNCTEDNQKLLDSTRNFMMAVSQFLNSQGEEGGTIREVDSYKKILTDQIQEGGIYR